MPKAEPNTEKVERVGQLKDRIEGSDALLLTEYRGLTVSDISELRRALAEGGTRFAVVKNTLMQRAAVDASIDELESLLEGPTAVAFIAGDPVAAAKKVVDAAKKFPALILKGGYMDGRVLFRGRGQEPRRPGFPRGHALEDRGDAEERDVRAAAVFVSAQSKFLSLLEAYKEKVPDDTVAEEGPAAGVEDVEDVEHGAEPGETPEASEGTANGDTEAPGSSEDTSEAAASDEEGDA